MNSDFFSGFQDDGPRSAPVRPFVDTMDTSDLRGARPRQLHGRYQTYAGNDPVLAPVEGSVVPKLHGRYAEVDYPILQAVDAPRQLHGRYSTNRRDSQLSTRDVNASVPHAKRHATVRETDPLDPHYNIPDPPPAPPLERPFIRDEINVDDIPGARPSQPAPATGRDPLAIDDIPGARYRYRDSPSPYQMRVGSRDYQLQVDDISQPRRRRSRQQTDPLNPQYQLLDGTKDDQESTMTRAAPGKSRATVRTLAHDRRAESEQVSLLSTEVEGRHVEPRERYRPQRTTNDVTDIAKAHSHPHATISMRSTRHSNPLEPNYEAHDQSTLPAQAEFHLEPSPPIQPPEYKPADRNATYGGPWRSQVPPLRNGPSIANLRTGAISDVLPGPTAQELQEARERWGVQPRESLVMAQKHALGNIDCREPEKSVLEGLALPDGTTVYTGESARTEAQAKRLMERTVKYEETQRMRAEKPERRVPVVASPLAGGREIRAATSPTMNFNPTQTRRAQEREAEIAMVASLPK